ncbi:hypothetical protein EDB86DRAFT_2928827 [Lactarius hatsudake]|nr:hypothetical protein EDB86DRAFT_2928827 [Lactarius hatsudake]
MSSAPQLSHATSAKAIEAALPAPVSSSTPSTTYSTPRHGGLRDFLMTEVDPDRSTIPLAAYCFMTWMDVRLSLCHSLVAIADTITSDVVSFSAVFVWCAFQTGNTLQLAIALARLFYDPAGQRDTSFHLADKQALTSVTTFVFGAFLGRIGDRMGAKTRIWLFLGTIFQSLLTMGSAIALWQSHQGSVASSTYASLGLMSMSMGLQGIMGKRVNTQFATTIVLTTVWCELMADPKLFILRPVTTRDHKIVGIAALFVGGFCSRAILQAIGSPASLGIAAGLRVLVALSWFFVPAKRTTAAKRP